MNGNSVLSGGQEIMFRGSALAGYFLCGTVYLLLPVIAYFLMKQFSIARKFPVLTGITVYFLSVRFADILAHVIGFSQPYSVQSVLAAEFVCITEEAGRWLAMRYPVTNIRKTSAAICYGIGHGGLECWNRGIQEFRIFHTGQQLNANGIGSFLAEKSTAQASAVAANLQHYADYPLYLCAADLLNSITTFCVQIALSVLIYRKMTETNFEKRWLLLAILLHYFLNAAVWLASFSEAPLFIHAVSILCEIAVMLIVLRVIDRQTCLNELLYPIEEEF